MFTSIYSIIRAYWSIRGISPFILAVYFIGGLDHLFQEYAILVEVNYSD
jgi:hypothetical protein